jgi:hypothetical protein
MDFGVKNRNGKARSGVKPTNFAMANAWTITGRGVGWSPDR